MLKMRKVCPPPAAKTREFVLFQPRTRRAVFLCCKTWACGRAGRGGGGAPGGALRRQKCIEVDFLRREEREARIQELQMSEEIVVMRVLGERRWEEEEGRLALQGRVLRDKERL